MQYRVPPKLAAVCAVWAVFLVSISPIAISQDCPLDAGTTNAAEADLETLAIGACKMGGEGTWSQGDCDGAPLDCSGFGGGFPRV